MKANELRIGNWLKLKGHDYVPTIVQAIHDLKGINTSVDPDFADIDNFEPIPLTKDWLQNHGFTEYAMSYYKKGEFYISYSNTGLNEYRIKDYAVIIKYAHQLQNIYFALTGGELI